jgi:hypothetical protein
MYKKMFLKEHCGKLGSPKQIAAAAVLIPVVSPRMEVCRNLIHLSIGWTTGKTRPRVSPLAQFRWASPGRARTPFQA